MSAARMSVWMDVMRQPEPVIADYERLFDAWSAGGVDGLVIGPPHFADGTPVCDPDPTIYRAVGLEPPPPVREPSPAARAHYGRALQAAKDRGWSVWLFQPGHGAPIAAAHPTLIVDARAQVAWSVRAIDALRHFPMVDGAIFDGPEWGYEIAPGHMLGPGGARSDLFADLPASVAPACAALGFDYGELVAGRDRLYRRLHSLSDRVVRRHGGAAGGVLGTLDLLGRDPALVAWLAFRQASLTACFAAVAGQVRSALPAMRLAAGPRTAATGIRRFIYHHHGNLTAAEWATVSRRCGRPWTNTDMPPLTASLTTDPDAMPGYYPPDRAVL